jgi:NACHT domain
VTLQELGEIKSANKDRAEGELIMWLSPKNDKGPTYYRDRYTELMKSRCTGTCEWVGDEELYQSWSLPESPESILWIHGNPGAGKSMLAASIIEHLLAQKQRHDILVLYFFFDVRGNDADKISPVALLRSLTYQVGFETGFNAKKNDILQEAMRMSGQSRASRFDTLWATFQALLCLQRASVTYVVIDALDECDNIEDIVPMFLGLASNTQTRFKALFTSRATSEPQLLELLDTFPSIEVTPIKTQKDMHAFVSSRTGLALGPRLKSHWEDIQNQILKDIDGMYEQLF